MFSMILRGTRLVKLHKCCNFSVSVSAFSNSFSSVAGCRKGKIFTVSYLIDSLSLTTKLAESISKKVTFEDKVNPDSVLSLFRSYGFTDSQISNVITNYPGLLVADVEKSLAPKLQFLQSRGASSSELAEIVSSVPKILGKRGGKTISVYYDSIKEFIKADKGSKLCHSLPQGSKQENKIRNVMALRELGVPQKMLFHLFISDHHVCCGKERFEESLKRVVEMGVDPTTLKFIETLKVVYRLSDKTIKEKVNICKRLGFTGEDVWEMFTKCPCFLNNSEKKIIQTFETLKKCGLVEDEVLSVLKKFPICICISEHKILNCMETFLGLGFSRAEFITMVKHFPPCIGLSAEMVKKKAEFLVKKMNWPRKFLVSNPSVLGYNLEKRTVPRCNVIKALMSKGLLGDTGSKLPSIGSVLKSTDEKFLNMFVMMHVDKELVDELMAIFNGGRVSYSRKRQAFCYHSS
ncbi:PREDICTED: transcription termination factor MTERF15, mitochondrial-like [Camelina sativa]|uniref:Transcription termination factor MTERF15, mitochondrial-like n=1 Tax=Camelina sativa TaxID=90675 RepID=A0ABM0TRP6_CAMSA|nr:PREDICTED: transcription termination factor MTERF15, mitochondrial-like [Camelina sativa]